MVLYENSADHQSDCKSVLEALMSEKNVIEIIHWISGSFDLWSAIGLIFLGPWISWLNLMVIVAKKFQSRPVVDWRKDRYCQAHSHAANQAEKCKQYMAELQNSSQNIQADIVNIALNIWSETGVQCNERRFHLEMKTWNNYSKLGML